MRLAWAFRQLRRHSLRTGLAVSGIAVAAALLLDMVMLSGGIAVMSGVARGSEAFVLIGSGLVGIGVGASVSPALFIAGFRCARLRSSACSPSWSFCAESRRS